MTARFRLGRRFGTATELFELAAADPLDEAAVWVTEVTAPALVIGSAQQIGEVVDVEACTRAGVEVVQRRSGGGAVLLGTGAGLWVDVVVPADHPNHVDDVSRSFDWLGGAWARAISATLGRPARVVATPRRQDFGGLVCFAGLGRGEVVDDRSGAKIVGLSQRRTRVGSRVSCLAVLAWDPVGISSLVRMPEAWRDELVDALTNGVVGLGVEHRELLLERLTVELTVT